MTKYPGPTFTLSMLHPKYWGAWFGFFFLALFVNILPYKILYKIGRGLGVIGFHLSKERLHITRRNLELAFPDQSDIENTLIIKENFKNNGMAFIETGIAWFWPTWRVKKLFFGTGLEALDYYREKKQGVLLSFPHFLTLELGARGFATLGYPGYGVYRPHNNPVYDLFQVWGRSHNGNISIHRKDVKRMIRILKEGGLLCYLGDHDYGRKKSVFVPFFAVSDACTTIGSSIFIQATDCAVIMGASIRHPDGKYEMFAGESVREECSGEPKEIAAFLNTQIEKTILKKLDQWMWLHKRYKTMEDENKPKGILYR